MRPSPLSQILRNDLVSTLPQVLFINKNETCVLFYTYSTSLPKCHFIFITNKYSSLSNIPSSRDND